MVNVKFYGALKQFGTDFKLDCKNVAEVLTALFSQIHGLRQHIQKGVYKVRIGSQYLDNRYLEKGLQYKLKDGMTVHFTPVVAGAGAKVQFVVGAALAVVGYAMSWTGVGAVVGSVGVSLMLGGVAQMLTKTPSMRTGSTEEKEKKSSTSFGGLQNMSAQGRPMPLAYGQILTGSLIISQGVETYDAETTKAENKRTGRRVGFAAQEGESGAAANNKPGDGQSGRRFGFNGRA